MLTPIDIHNKEFKRSFRGYNDTEVDDFLDQVINDYEKLYRENDDLKAEVAHLKKELDHYHTIENSLQETLKVAQRTAEEVTSNARSSADTMRIIAERDCQSLRQKASMEAQQMVDEAKGKVRAIGAEYDKLSREKDQFLRKLRLTMESELALLDEALSSIRTNEEKNSAGGAAEDLRDTNEITLDLVEKTDAETHHEVRNHKAGEAIGGKEEQTPDFEDKTIMFSKDNHAYEQ